MKQNRTGGNDGGVVDGPGIEVIFVAASYFLCLLYWSRDVTGRLGGWWDVDVEQGPDDRKLYGVATDWWEVTLHKSSDHTLSGACVCV